MIVEHTVRSGELLTISQEEPHIELGPGVENVQGMSPADANRALGRLMAGTYAPGVTQLEAALEARNAFYRVHGQVLHADDPTAAAPSKVIGTADLLTAVANRQMLLATHRFTETETTGELPEITDPAHRKILQAQRDTDWRLKFAVENDVSLYPLEANLALKAIAIECDRIQPDDEGAYARWATLQAAAAFVNSQVIDFDSSRSGS